MEKYKLVPIDKSDYTHGTGLQKIIPTSEPNYFYKLSINDSELFIDSNGDNTRFIILEEINTLIFASENRFYILALTDGSIKLAIKTFEEVVQCKVINGFIFLFTEKGFYKVDLNTCTLYSMDTFSDVITNIIFTEHKIIVSCFDDKAYEIDS